MPRQPPRARVVWSAGMASKKGSRGRCSAGLATATRDMATRAPVKYRVAETGACAPSLRARRSTPGSPQPRAARVLVKKAKSV
ncbi:MAG: hypothetical protein Q6370_012775 [Candidatus Sigynarchaeota archaeon]